MIYWYSWGDHEFDIRTMRKVLGMRSEYAADKWFTAKKPNACGSFSTIMTQIQTALNGMPFSEAMALHDAEKMRGYEIEKQRLTAPGFIPADYPF